MLGWCQNPFPDVLNTLWLLVFLTLRVSALFIWLIPAQADPSSLVLVTISWECHLYYALPESPKNSSSPALPRQVIESAKETGKKKRKKDWEEIQWAHYQDSKKRKSWEKNTRAHIYFQGWVDTLLLLPKWMANLKLSLEKEKESSRPKSQSITFSIENKNRWEVPFLVIGPQAEELPLPGRIKASILHPMAEATHARIQHSPNHPEHQSRFSWPSDRSSSSLVRKCTVTTGQSPSHLLSCVSSTLRVHFVQTKGLPWVTVTHF